MTNVDLTRLQTTAARAASDLAEAQADAAQKLVAALDAYSQTLTGAVPRAEMASWTKKERAARAITALATPDPADLALLTAERARTGETEAALVARIITRADAYSTAAGTIAGLRRAYGDQIEAAADTAAVAAIVTAFQTEIAGL